ncbi:MAG: ABC transporter permease [Acidimicrobiia bacterium]|nr:MAG: ABC transporter permease [Acidimicrobiia bacterium]
MRGWLAMVRTTMRQLAGGKRLLLFGLLAALPGVVMWLSSGGLTADGVERRFDEAPIAILFLVVVPIVSLILGAGALGDERRDDTLSFLALRPRPRWSIAAAKIFAAWLVAAALVAASGAAAAAAVGARSGDWSRLGPVALGAAVSAMAYCAVFVPLGYLTARAVLLGLLYVFIWESGFTFAAASLANVSLFRIGLSAYAGLVPESRSILDDVLGSVTPGAGGAVAKAIAVAFVATIATGSLLKRRDLGSE